MFYNYMSFLIALREKGGTNSKVVENVRTESLKINLKSPLELLTSIEDS